MLPSQYVPIVELIIIVLCLYRHFKKELLRISMLVNDLVQAPDKQFSQYKLSGTLTHMATLSP